MKLLVLAMALLAGCAVLEPVAVDGILNEAVVISRASSGEQKAALSRAQQSFLASASASSRLRLATLLATLPAPFRDDARATELLEPVADTHTRVGRYAAFLLLQIAERQRLARELEKIAKERVAIERERLTIERERQTVEKERDKREEVLRQQLEALRAIERGILEREERVQKRPGAKP